MKLVDNLREKIGDDKILHFLVFGIAVSYGLFFSLIFGLIVFVLMAGLSILKEKKFDNNFNAKDIYSGLIGGGVSLVIYILSMLI